MSGEDLSLKKIESEVINAHPQLASLNKEQRRTVAQVLMQVQGHAYSGPIPPPEQMRQFNEVIPNGADWIMKMAEEQLQHRTGTDSKIVSWQLFGNVLGQVLGFLIAICVLSAAVIGGTTIVGLAAAFVKGQQAK